jgi:hypothetical protein
MPWYEYSNLGGGRPRPLVEVILWHGVQRVRLYALVDSGASTSLLDLGLALAVGLDPKDAVTEQAVTAGGGMIEVQTWPKAKLELQFERDRFPFKGAFVAFDEDDDAVSLVGRSDFFDRFIVTLWDAEGLLNVDRSPYDARLAIGARRGGKRKA